MPYPPTRHRYSTRTPNAARLLLISITIAGLCFLPFLVRSFARTNAHKTTANFQRQVQAARLSDSISVQAAGRGNPTINLSDGHDLLISYNGPADLCAALEQNLAEPRSLASADFDEDGVPDLVGGYAYNGQGFVTLLRGNVDSNYPNAPEAQRRRANGTFTNAPFLSPAQVFAASVGADFIGAGDFDGDSHWDVVAAERGGQFLTLLSGDGRGGFEAPKTIGLFGKLTVMNTGEVNRADGLTDVVVGVDTSHGPAVLVFEGPNGALSKPPEVLPMPDAVTALVLGQLDNSYEMDLAVGAGERLEVVHGRDRKLSLPSEQQEKVLPAKIETHVLSASIKSLVIGDFTPGHGQSLAVLTADGQVRVVGPSAISTDGATPIAGGSSWHERSVPSGAGLQAMQLVRAKASSLPSDDLLILDANDQLRLLAGAAQDAAAEPTTLDTTGQPIALLPMRLNGDALTDLVVLQKGQSAPGVMVTAPAQIFVVNSTADTNDGACTTAVNGCTVREAINAANNNPGADTINFNVPGSNFTITLVQVLQQLNETVTIDGTTQPGFPGTPIIELNGNNGNFAAIGLNSVNCLIRGLVINRFQGAPIGGLSNGEVIEGNYLGVNVAGNAALTNGQWGILMGNGASNLLIGGTTTAARNVISGFTSAALFIGGDGTSGVVIQGNFIGTDSTGQTVLGNGANANGIQLFRATNSTIGGTTPQTRNVFAGWAVGIAVGDSSTGILVQGNYVGTNVTGTIALPNTRGAGLVDSSNNTVGGTVSSARNLISGNRSYGFIANPFLTSTTSGNVIQGNFIGTNVNGTGALPNGADGVSFVTGSNGNTVGGTAAGAMNLISGNAVTGVTIGGGSNDNQVIGNLIGTDVTGTFAVPNGQRGVFIKFSDRNTIGGTTAAARNVISGNLDAGVRIYGGIGGPGSPPGSASNNAVQGNFIGTDVTGTQRLANGTDGVQLTVQTGSANNTVGGASAAMRNIISGNGGNGVAIGIHRNDPDAPGSGGTGVTVQNNYIGTDVSGNNCLGNTLDGLNVDADSFDNTFRDNLIACNGRNGVFIPQNANPGVRIFIDNNSVFANALLGIDLGNAGITPNDPLDPDVGANFQQNFPVLTSFATAPAIEPSISSKGNAGRGELPKRESPDAPEVTVTVNGSLNSTPNSTFTVHWYFSGDSQCTTNQATSRPLVTGKIPGVATDNSGNASFNFPFDFPVGINNGIINTTATDAQGNTSEFSSCLPVNSVLPTVKLSASSYNASESAGSMSVTLQRAGDTSAPSTINYATGDSAGANNCNVLNSGKASSRCDYETTAGTLRFAAGETSKTIMIPIIDDAYGEGSEGFTMTLSTPTGATLDSPSAATITITDNETTTGTNPINDAAFFVRLHYIDFLNREPDAGGLGFWSNQITSCGTDQACTEIRRINVSAAFFLSIEFQETGYLVERIYRAAYGSATGNSTFPNPHQLSVPIIRFNEFLPDTQQIGRGVVVGQTGWEQVLENNKQTFMNEFVQRSRFKTAYPGTMTPAQYVDALNVNAGNALSTTERNQLVSELTNGTKTRAQVLRAVAEDSDLNAAESNRAFVLMQFFGYLRRNPNDAPDSDHTGYDFWLSKLNQFNGNFVNAEMVKAFIISGEYKQRFGP